MMDLGSVVGLLGRSEDSADFSKFVSDLGGRSCNQKVFPNAYLRVDYLSGLKAIRGQRESQT